MLAPLMGNCCSTGSSHAYNNLSFTANSGTVNFSHFYNAAGNAGNSSYNQVTFSAGANITGDITVGTIIMTSNNTYNLQAGRTVTVTNNISFGSICFGGVTLQSGTAGTQAILTKASGTVSGQNLNIKDINATGGATYNAFGSTNMGNNTGWNFLATQAVGNLGAISTTGNGFSVSPIAGAVSYTWTMPAGTIFSAGQGTNVITASNANGQICVTATNGCGSTSAASCISTGIVSIDLGGVTNTNVCQGFTTVNRTYVGTNGSPNQYSIDFNATANAAGIADIVNANITSSPLVFNIPNNVSPAVYNGVLTVTNSNTSISSINYNITVSVVGNPTMSITNSPTVCQGITSSSLIFTATSNSPNQYSIDYDATANAASFVDIVNQALAGSPVPLAIPAAATPATYLANLTILNTSTSCQTIYPISIVVNAIPAATFGGNPSVVVGTASTSIGLSALVGSPNQYSINFDNAANSAGFVDLNNQAVVGASIPISIPGAAVAGTYNATIVLTNSTTGCSSASIAITVTLNASAPPSITLGANPSICTGTTIANLSYSNATNNPNEYTIDFDASANAAGLADINWVAIVASPFALQVPANIAAGTYTGSINVRNTITNISGTAQNFSILVGTTPSITLNVNPSVSVGALTASFTFTSPVGSPNVYTLNFNNAANSAGFVDQNNAALTGNSISVPIPAGATAGNYVATLVVTNSASGCSSPVYNVAVSIINGINYYWVGGTGNWGDINRWSATDGGAGGAGVPGVNDNVYFTNNSFSAPNQTVTLNLANANCVNMYWTVTTNTPNFASTSSANNLNIYGSLLMTSLQGSWTTSMNVYFLGNGLNTINPGGKTFGTVFFNGTGTWSNVAAWNTGNMNVNQAATLNFTNDVTM
ncbi:MAG: hypothetical protein NT109_07015, partial [Flavobacteriia bacterium]|nr:hypothetical protein [Flavobacteriia bacterium]